MHVYLNNSSNSVSVMVHADAVMISAYVSTGSVRSSMTLSELTPESADELADALRKTADEVRRQRADKARLDAISAEALWEGAA